MSISSSVTEQPGRAPTRAPRTDVLVHLCFSQRDRQKKPHHCLCNKHISTQEALEWVNDGTAEWLTSDQDSPLGPRKYVSHHSIVVRQTAAAVEDYIQGRRHYVRKNYLDNIRRRRLEFAQKNEADAIRDLKGLLRKEVATYHLDASRLDEVISLLPQAIKHDPELLQQYFSPASYQKALSRISRFWEGALLSHNLAESKVAGESRGCYMADAPHGCGVLVSGGYDAEKIGYVQAAHDRAGYPDLSEGSWDSSGTYHHPIRARLPNIRVVLAADEIDCAPGTSSRAREAQLFMKCYEASEIGRYRELTTTYWPVPYDPFEGRCPFAFVPDRKTKYAKRARGRPRKIAPGRDQEVLAVPVNFDTDAFF